MQDIEFHNLEAEIAILGGILYEGDLIKDVALLDSHFYERAHQIIFRAMKHLESKEKPIDIVSVYSLLAENDLVTKLGGISYLNKLLEAFISKESFINHAELVKDAWKLRKSLELANQLQNELQTKRDLSSIDAFAKKLQEIEDDIEPDEFNMQKSLETLYENMQLDKQGLSGIDTGFKELNRMIDGMKEQEFVVVGARPSMGKTAFALNIARFASQDSAVGIFSLEMPEEHLLKRLIAAEGNIHGMKLQDPKKRFDAKDWHRLSNTMGIINKLNLEIWDTPAISVEDIKRRTRKFKKKHPDKKVLVIIDYLQLIVGNSKHGGNRVQEISEISRELKLLARKQNVCVMALSQLSRGVESRQNKRPMMSDIRESGQIEQDADIIAFLYRDDYYDKESESKDIIEVIIGKQRNGPIGTVELVFVKEFNKFVDLERRPEETK